jgi:hypothetical protein
VRLSLLVLALAMALSHVACVADNTRSAFPPEAPAETSPKKVEGMKIRITIGERVITATMHDNATARDFISLLPLTLTLEDYAKTKNSRSPKKIKERRRAIGQ